MKGWPLIWYVAPTTDGSDAVLPLPGVVTHHGDRRRAFLVVGIGEQAAAPGGNAERLRRNCRRRTRRCRSRQGLTNRRAARPIQRSLPIWNAARSSNAGVLARKNLYASHEKKLQSVLRVAVWRSNSGRIADAPELVGLRDRQRPQHHLLYQRENRRGRADAQRERATAVAVKTGDRLS